LVLRTASPIYEFESVNQGKRGRAAHIRPYHLYVLPKSLDLNQVDGRRYVRTLTKKSLKTIQEERLTIINQVKKHLRKNLISNCAELNPTGECCHRAFNEIIRKALKKQI